MVMGILTLDGTIISSAEACEALNKLDADNAILKQQKEDLECEVLCLKTDLQKVANYD